MWWTISDEHGVDNNKVPFSQRQAATMKKMQEINLPEKINYNKTERIQIGLGTDKLFFSLLIVYPVYTSLNIRE